MFSEADKELVRLFSRLVITNPFLPARTELEKELLGSRYQTLYDVWNCVSGRTSVNSNLEGINQLCDSLVQRGLAEKLVDTRVQSALEEWDRLCLYWLFSKYSQAMNQNTYMGKEAEAENAKLFGKFKQDYQRVIMLPNRVCQPFLSVEDTFALYHQIHRAFNCIFDFIAGSTQAAAELRASIWQSIFTCNFSIYCRQMLRRMNEVTTLITGESGTGKELVARAIAFSQFIPFDSKTQRFAETFSSCFMPVQLSAMPQTLVETELFGHVKGAFTDAVNDRKGCFETCGACGCIFLDEIGDVSPETQVKLLRLLQTRRFKPIGGNDMVEFRGKVIAATNADLSEACAQGRFRQDLLFRICSDTIQTAPLRQLIDGREDELRQFVLVLTKRMLAGKEAEEFAERSGDWIVKNLKMNYPWPGNVRELEQCLRNLLIRGSYAPVGQKSTVSLGGSDAFFASCRLNADELLHRYVKAIFAREGSVLATAKITGLDRRTIRKYLDENKE